MHAYTVVPVCARSAPSCLHVPLGNEQLNAGGCKPCAKHGLARRSEVVSGYCGSRARGPTNTSAQSCTGSFGSNRVRLSSSAACLVCQGQARSVVPRQCLAVACVGKGLIVTTCWVVLCCVGVQASWLATPLTYTDMYIERVHVLKQWVC